MATETTTPSVSWVLIIPEIMEHLLSFLELKDLLRIQSVCSSWRDFVSASSVTQQRLFFLPDTNPKAQDPQLNPLLLELFPSLLQLNRPLRYSWLHSLFLVNETEKFVNPQSRDRILRPEASWRRMFPVQPPAKLDLVNIHGRDSCLYSDGELLPLTLGTAYQHMQDGGLRMGLLYDLVVLLHAVWPAATFFVHYKMFPVRPSVEKYYDGRSDEGEDYDAPGYAPLNLNVAGRREFKRQDSIELYFNHDWLCYGGVEDFGLTIQSEFTRAVKRNPRSLFEIVEGSGGNSVDNWDDYLPVETVRKLRPNKRVYERRIYGSDEDDDDEEDYGDEEDDDDEEEDVQFSGEEDSVDMDDDEHENDNNEEETNETD